MLSGPSLVDTVFIMQTRRAHDAAFRMITKYLPLLDCVHCHICLGISWCGDFCDENRATDPKSMDIFEVQLEKGIYLLG